MNAANPHGPSGDLDRLASEIGPHLGTGTLLRSVLEVAVAKVGRSDDIAFRGLVDRTLAAARIHVVEDVPYEVVTRSVEASVVARESAPDPLEAGRRRLELDRMRPASTRHKVLLNATEEIGLTLLARPTGDPLEAGGFGRLEGEAREAAEAMVLHNLRLAHSVARAYRGQGLEYDDLYSHALIGLMRAVEKFDPAAGFKFSTYATWWLRQAATRAIANESRLIRLPVHMWEQVRKVVATRERMTAVDGRPPTRKQLANECHLTVEKVDECLKLAPRVLSLETPLGDDNYTLGDLVDAQADWVEHIEVNGLFPDDIDDLMLELADRESDVLRMRYGLSPYDRSHTLDEIGQVYGVTRERIRQIESKAFTRVRAVLTRRGFTVSKPQGKREPRAHDKEQGRPLPLSA